MKRVRTEQQAQWCGGEFGPQRRQRIERIRGAAANEFAVIRDQPLTVERPGQHLETDGAVDERRRPMVRHVQRYKPDGIEIQQLGGFDRESDVADVNRVERTPEDPDRAPLRSGIGHLADATVANRITRGYVRHQSRSIFAT